MTQPKQTVTAKAKLGLIALVVVAFIAGVVTTRAFSASPDTNNSNGNNDQARGEDAALVVDSLEQYMQFHAPPGTHIEAGRVQALKFRDNLATGLVNNGDSGNRFFARKDKIDGWLVFFQGQDNPPQDVTDKYHIPKDWLGPEF